MSAVADFFLLTLGSGGVLFPIVLLGVVRVKGHRRKFVFRVVLCQVATIGLVSAVMFLADEPFDYMNLWPLMNFLFIAVYTIVLTHPIMFEKADD